MIFSATFPQKGYKNLETLKLNSSLQNNYKESQIPSVINTFHRDSPLVSGHAGSSVTEIFLPSVKKKDGRALVLAMTPSEVRQGWTLNQAWSPALFPSLSEEGSRIPLLREQNISSQV